MVHGCNVTAGKPQQHDRLAWLISEIMPHERDIRSFLGRQQRYTGDIDDFIQEAYARMYAVDSFREIRCGRAYFFVVVKNIVRECVRKSQVAHRYALELDSGVLERIQDDRPSQEHVLLWRDEWQRLQRTIDDMPERCRDVFIQRRVLGSSQRETAEFLNISENVVEKEAARGLRMIAHATPDEYAPAL